MLLEKLAHDVITAWKAGSGLAASIDALKTQLAEISSIRGAHADVITEARGDYAEPSNYGIEIDEEPFLSIGEAGIWVSAWVWVATPNNSKGED